MCSQLKQFLTDSECSCNLKTKRAYLSLSFDYRKYCTCSTATPSMPADPPLTLGTLAQISFARRIHLRPKSPPRAGSTLKVSPAAKGSTKGVVGCGLSQVLGEDDRCLAALLRALSSLSLFPLSLSLSPPPCTPFGCRYANTFKCACLSSAKRPKGTAVLFSPQLERMIRPPTTMLSSFPRVPPTFMLRAIA